MGRWLEEDCDGYRASDAVSQVDTLLAQSVPGHQPIANDAERRQRYWTSLHFDPRTTHRRIYFGIRDADGDERFVLGETLVLARPHPIGPALIELDLYGRPISPTNPVVVTNSVVATVSVRQRRHHSKRTCLRHRTAWDILAIDADLTRGRGFPIGRRCPNLPA